MSLLLVPITATLVMFSEATTTLTEQTDVSSRVATPLGNPGEWIAPSDYPVISLINGSTGTATFKLSIDTKGVPVDCAILDSSGDVVLDAATCELIRKRARFEPVKDENGRLTPSTYTNRVRWVLPSTTGRPEDNSRAVTIEAEVASNGVVERCRIIQKDEYIFKNVPDPCPQWLGQRVFKPNPNMTVPKLKMRVTQSVEFEVVD